MRKGNDNTPFFVLGAARSGTTMLRLMLNRHSRLAIPFESHFLKPILAELPMDRPLEAHEAARMAEIISQERNFRTWHLDSARIKSDLVGRTPASLAQLVDALYRMEIAGSGKPRWGDKTPYYYVCWRQLVELFPSSRLIHIIRDGRDVNLSLERVGWHGPTLADRARYWLERVEMAQEAERELGPERNLIIRYEDLVLNATLTLQKVCDFLDEEFEDGMLEFFTDAAAHLSDVDGDVHKKVLRAPRPDDVARWRREMPVDRQEEFETIAGSGLRATSYPCLFFERAETAMRLAPRSGQAKFAGLEDIYYTTDDGFQQLTPREETRHDVDHLMGLYRIFNRYENFYQRVTPDRRNSIHFASVVGGLYGLNLIPIFRPREITFFDINPHAVSYFDIIRRVWIDSRDAPTFLARLAHGDYQVETESEVIIRRCIARKQHRTLTAEEGQSARSILSSWRYAIDRFDLTRGLLADTPIHTRVQAMNAPGFKDFVANQENLWLYCSNIFLFVFFDLTFRFPRNAAIFASYFDVTDMLDLGSHNGAPVTVRCQIPMAVMQRPDGDGG
jgi:hypothetical protein